MLPRPQSRAGSEAGASTATGLRVRPCRDCRNRCGQAPICAVSRPDRIRKECRGFCAQAERGRGISSSSFPFRAMSARGIRQSGHQYAFRNIPFPNGHPAPVRKPPSSISRRNTFRDGTARADRESYSIPGNSRAAEHHRKQALKCKECTPDSKEREQANQSRRNFRRHRGHGLPCVDHARGVSGEP